MAKRILIIGPAWVGDTVMAQSLFKLLHEQDPAVQLDVLAPAGCMPLLARMPEVASALILPVGHGELKLSVRYHLAKQLRNNNYDQAIVLPGSFKSALVPWWAKIPVRTGWLGEWRWGLLNDVRYLDKKKYPLMIERYLALGLDSSAALPKQYPIPQLIVTPVSQKEIGQEPILVLCPGAEFGPAKRWPEEYYAAVAQAKLKDGWAVWLMGSQKDRPITAKIMELTSHRCIDFAGKTRLDEAIDLLSLATAVVSNDSGLMHIAAALHKPLIALYGPTSAAHTPPLNEKAKILSLSLSCQPCFQRECPLKHQKCMRDLRPERVIEHLCAF